MYVIKLIFLIFLVGYVNADEQYCGKDYPRFKSVPPEIIINQEVEGAVGISVKHEYDGFKLHALNLSILIPYGKRYEQINVPLRFYKQGDYVETGITTTNHSQGTKYHINARYTDHQCGPSVSLDFSI